MMTSSLNSLYPQKQEGENHHFDTDGSMAWQMNEMSRCTQETERQMYEIHPWHNVTDNTPERKVLTVPGLTDNLK